MPRTQLLELESLLGHRFSIESEQGRGTSGIVYKARDKERGRVVALKVVATETESARERFVNEAALLQSVRHEHVIGVLDSGLLTNNQAWLAMEWLDGESLEQRQRHDPLGVSASVELIALVGDAVQAAHAVNVIHRDIKPANIFLTHAAGGALVPKLIDFGAATRIDRERLADTTIIGTPAYMAPEQVRGDTHIDARCDIYALGATLYELLGGQPPHCGPTHFATLARLATTRPQSLCSLRPSIPPFLDEFVQLLLSLSPEKRPARAADVANSLRGFAEQLKSESLGDAEPQSSRLGSMASRILTTIVALDFPNSAARDQALPSLANRSVDAVPLAQDALVAHLGARQTQGNEAVSALRLGQRLALGGARVGVATGRALVPFADLDKAHLPNGEVVDRAMALAHRASERQVLADATTSELGRGRYEFVARPDGSAVLRARIATPRTDVVGGTPFVGRDAELGQLKAGFQRAISESHAVVISISGPPGIGKTRLQREAIARFSAGQQAHSLVHQRNEAYGQRRALGAAVDIIRTQLQLPKEADTEACRAAINRHIDDPPATMNAQIDLLSQLISGQQVQGKEEVRDYRDALWLVMTQLIATSLKVGPVLIISEDLQWADPESVAWFEHLLSRFHAQPLILLVTARQAFWQSNPTRFEKPTHIRIVLHPISNQATQAIAAAIVGKKIEPRQLAQIVRQSAGSPLYAEELSRLLVAGTNIQLAPTIESAIQASLDVLAPSQRAAVGLISVYGQAGWDEAIEALGITDPEVVLSELCASEILTEQDSSRFFGLREWHFKHGLVRDVAYDSLALQHKQELHALAAKWLETVSEDSAIIARHFDLAEEPELAANHWALAAERALATNALTDALMLAERALTFATNRNQSFARARIWDEAWSLHDDRASDRESAILALEEHAHNEVTQTYARGARARYDAARGQGQQVDQRLRETIQAAQELQLHDEEARCAATLARRLAFAGNFEEAESEAARLLKISRNKGMRTAAVDAWQTFAIVRQSEGSLSSALDARRSAVRAAKEAGLTDQESILTTNLGFALTTVGARVEARELLERGLQLAEEIGSLSAKRHALMLLLCWAGTFGSDRALQATLGEVRDDADAKAGGMWTAPARENLGNLYYRGVELLRTPNQRNVQRAQALLSVATRSYRETKNRDVLPVALGMWARAELALGNPKEALSLAKEATVLLDSEGHSLLNESPVYLALHDAQLQLGAESEAHKAVALGMPPLMKRIRGLARTPYVRPFLTELEDNARLIACAESYGVMPERVREFLGRDAS